MLGQAVCAGSHGWQTPAVCLIDARLQEWYVGFLGVQTTSPAAIAVLAKAQLMPAPQAQAHAQPETVSGAAPWLLPFADQKLLVEPTLWPQVQALAGIRNESLVQVRPGAQGLVAVAWKHFQAGLAVAPHACQPFYVRNNVAQTTEQRRATRNG
ncbi:MAG: hypothetical protein HC848_10730 [Limnobacter sp.]|nr:hypothetical protein [Limnobacter sp.]